MQHRETSLRDVFPHAFAGYATVAMANAHLYDGPAALAGHTRIGMDGRAVIEQAKGIVMAGRSVRRWRAHTFG